MGRPQRRRRASRVVVVLGLLLASAGVGAVVGPTAPAQAVERAGPPPEAPARGYPIIRQTPVFSDTLRRQVKATDQVGRIIVAGGDFLDVERPDGSVVRSQYFAAWSIDTKQLVCPGAFTFDKEVLAIAPGPRPRTVFVGGRFTRVSGIDGVDRVRAKVALLDLETCQVDPSFTLMGTNNKVNNLVLSGSRLFVGGDFTRLAAHDIETVAELDVGGRVNPAFSFSTTGELADRVLGMGVDPSGTRLFVGGRFGTMAGNGRSVPAPTAVIDISDPSAPLLTGHRSSGYPAIGKLQDVGVAADGGAFALAYGLGDKNDYVYLTSTLEQPVGYTWRHFMRDSSFGIGVSADVVYVAGHFCKPDAGPGPSELMAPKFGLTSCTGSRKFAGGVWRTKLAALARADGTPLAWNPGSNAWTGGRAVTVTPRGLLVGFDGERTDTQRTGAVAFFDFGPGIEDHAPPGDVTFTSPGPGSVVSSPVTISGSAPDDAGVAGYLISIQAVDGRWMRPDGTVSPTYTEASAFADVTGAFTLEAALPPGTYTVRARAVDGLGQRSPDVAALDFGVAPDGAEAPRIDPVTAQTSVVGDPVSLALTATDSDGGPVRFSAAGLPTGLAIDPATGTVSGTPTAPGVSTVVVTATDDEGQAVAASFTWTVLASQPPPECTVATAGGGVTVEWTPVAGVTTYQVRADGQWLASVAGTTYVDADGSTALRYVIRHRLAGAVIDRPCQAATP